jgi:endoglucanase
VSDRHRLARVTSRRPRRALTVAILVVAAGAILVTGAEFALPTGKEERKPPLDTLASAPIVAPASSGAIPDAPQALAIAVNGNHLVDAAGAIVTLHGVDVSSSEWECLYGHAFESPESEASIAAIAAWHVNAVRIPLNEDCWLGINGAPRHVVRYHRALRSYIARLHAHGLYAILDLHWDAPGKVLSHWGRGYAGSYEMADESHTPAFWQSVATYFKTDHAVLFDLFNEPFGISWHCWLDGCIAPRGFQTAGMQQLVDVVRATGATQPIMVGGLEHAVVAGNAWLANRPTDPAEQLVASVHVYDQRNTARFNSNIGVVAEHFPVVAGEIGETDCADRTLEAFLPWADAHGVSYLAWAWFTGRCASYPALISSYSGTPTQYGAGYRDHLLASFPPTEP